MRYLLVQFSLCDSIFRKNASINFTVFLLPEKIIIFVMHSKIKTIFDLKTTITNIAERWKYKVEEVNPEIFRGDVAIKMKGESWHYQFVYAWIIAGRHFGKDVVYFNSRGGEYNPNINHYKLLKEEDLERMHK